MSDKNKQKKQETTNSQQSYNDGWCVVSTQKKQNDKENSTVTQAGKETISAIPINKNVAVATKISKNINLSIDSGFDDKSVDSRLPGRISPSEKKKSMENNNNDTNSVTSKSEETSNSQQITPTDKFNQFRERLNEQTKRYYYFEKQFFKIYNCQQINGLDSNQIIKLKDESAPIFQDLRNIILSYINYNGGIIFFGFNHIKRDNSPHMEVNGFDINKNDRKKYDILHKTIETIVSRITPSKIKYDISIMKVRKDKNQDRFTQEKYVARIIVQQGSDLRTLYSYKEPLTPSEPISAKYSKKDFKFITIKGNGFTQAQDQKKQLTKVKDLIFTHIDDFYDPQSSYANIKNSKLKMSGDPKKGSNEDQNGSFNDDSKYKSDDEMYNEEDYQSNYSNDSYDSQEEHSHNRSNDLTDQQTATSVKDEEKKVQEIVPNKEIVVADVGQWNTELPTDKGLQPGKGKGNQNNNYLLTNQDEEAFPQISSFGQKSSSQIDQGDSQSNSSINQYESSYQLQYGQQIGQDQYNNLGVSYQNSSHIAKINENKAHENQVNLQQNSISSQNTDFQSQQAILYQQQQQHQLLLKNMYLNQAQQQQQQQLLQQQQTSINQVIPNQNQLLNQNSNLVSLSKPAEYTQQQQQKAQMQIQNQKMNVPSVMVPNPNSFQVYSPLYLQYPHSQSSTPIPLQTQPQVINYQNNHESKFNNSLKSLSNSELQELLSLLDHQMKNYQDYLYLAKSEEQRRKFESQMHQNNAIMQNMHHKGIPQGLNVPTPNNTNNGSHYSNSHSNSSLAN